MNKSQESEVKWGWRKLRALEYSDEKKKVVKVECEKKNWKDMQPNFSRDEEEAYYWVMVDMSMSWKEGMDDSMAVDMKMEADKGSKHRMGSI